MPATDFTTALTTAPLSEIAAVIAADWPKVKEAGTPTAFGNIGQHPANPYWDAMTKMQSVNDRYGLEDGHMIVAYFLGNATGWRGDTARAVKAELKRRTA